jgi:hypothetical protein
MRVPTAIVCAAVLAGCGSDAPTPSSGAAYRALSPGERLDAAAECRDRAADAARGVAAKQLRAVDPRALRAELDVSAKAKRGREFGRLCDEALPFVTPGLRVTFAGATDSGDTFTYQTRSDRPLTLRGTVAAAAGGDVVARREFGASKPFRGEIGPDGSFVLPTVRLRKQANNSFLVAIHAPPNAPREVRFSAICVDCLAR